MCGTKARIELADPANGAYAADVLIPNKKGLHARASAQFARSASELVLEGDFEAVLSLEHFSFSQKIYVST